MSTIQLKAADGHVLDAYCAQGAAPLRAIVILQEIFGVNTHIRAVCDRFATRDYLAIAPALFDRAKRSQALGYDEEGIAQGRALKSQITNEQALLDVQAAIDHAVAAKLPVAVLGFCWGGTLAWLAAARLKGLAATIAFYGTNIADHLDEEPKVPIQLHFGDHDKNIPPDQVHRIAQAWPRVPLYRYPAGHGFNCEDRPAFHARSAAIATDRSRDFLRKYLSC